MERQEFKKLNKKLIDVCYKLIENQELCKLISVDNTNPLATPDIESPENLIDDRIVPDYTNPETIEDTRTILNIYFDNIKGTSYAYNGMTLCFRILTHGSLKRIEGGSRVYEIVDTLLDSFDAMTGLGLGGLELDIGKLFVVNKDYQGMVLSFKINEFK